MKYLIVITFCILSMPGVFAQKIKGSDTVLPLAQKEAEVFMGKNKAARITVTGGGSGVGISSLVDNTTDIAMASRKMKLSEKMKLSNNPVTEVIIANDALSVIVHSSNKVKQLTREQLEEIFTGKINNWKQVGGDDMKIIVYGRESSSGTYDFFKEHVLDNKNYASSVLSMPATGAIVQSVSQTKGAIGYVGMAYVEKTTRALKVSFDQGKTFVEPTLKTAKNKTYPISRPLYFYHLKSAEKSVKPFIDFVLSKAGQEIVSAEGFIPVK